jgi:hypothetical protein
LAATSKAKSFFLTHIQSFLLPIRVLINPKDTYERMRYTVRQAPLTIRAIANIYAYIGFSMISAMFILISGFLYSIYKMATLNITDALGGFAHSVIAAFTYPLFIAIALGFLDAILIIIPAKLLDKNTPDYLGILLIRTSSLIGYSIKPAVIAFLHGPDALSIKGVYKSNITGHLAWLSLTVTLITYILTVYGLVKSGGLRKNTAILSSSVPVVLHVLA